MEKMKSNAKYVAAFLKGLASEHRLLILCNLVDGEKTVGELIEATGIPQTSMSQHLSKLKSEGIVTFRRDHRTLYYSIAHDAVHELMSILHNHFCHTEGK